MRGSSRLCAERPEKWTAAGPSPGVAGVKGMEGRECLDSR